MHRAKPIAMSSPKMKMLLTSEAAASSTVVWWPIISVSAKFCNTTPICPIINGVPKWTRAR